MSQFKAPIAGNSKAIAKTGNAELAHFNKQMLIHELIRGSLILITGRCEFEAGDGKRTTCRAGDVVMLDDLIGKGHQTKVLGDEAVRIAAIHFS